MKSFFMKIGLLVLPFLLVVASANAAQIKFKDIEIAKQLNEENLVMSYGKVVNLQNLDPGQSYCGMATTDSVLDPISVESFYELEVRHDYMNDVVRTFRVFAEDKQNYWTMASIYCFSFKERKEDLASILQIIFGESAEILK